jgi:hypothetical protein
MGILVTSLFSDFHKKLIIISKKIIAAVIVITKLATTVG